MSTINGVTFNLSNLSVVSTHRSTRTNHPGSDTNYITDMGYDGLTIQLEGFERTLAVYDNVMAEFMKSGEQTLSVISGWQFKVHSVRVSPQLLAGKPNYWPYSFELITSTPYRESVATKTINKTITANNQTWSASDAAVDITTSGTVVAIPAIQIAAGDVGAAYSEQYGSLTDVNDATEHALSQSVYLLLKTVTLSAVEGRANAYTFTSADYRLNYAGYTLYFKTTYQSTSLAGGVETQLYEDSHTGDIDNTTKTSNASITAGHNEDLVIRYYAREINGNTVWIKNIRYKSELRRRESCTNPIIYNTSDTTVKLNVANRMIEDSVHRINADGTGTVSYSDDFSTSKYLDAYDYILGVTIDSVNGELDIADAGYISYTIDTKYPVTGIPTLTATIDITVGTPTIQISTNASTWYDIDTAIVDNVSTVYQLDNTVSLQLDGKTSFYFRFDCVKAAAATCSIKTFALAVNIVTIDAEHPVINTGAANTFRCDQDASSGLACTVDLVYKDRSWA